MHSQTFLHKQEPAEIHTRHRRRQFLRSIWIVILVIFVGWVLLLGLAVGQLFAAGLDLKEAIINAQEDAQQQNFDQAQIDLQRASAALAELEQSVGFVRMLWFLPGLDRPLADFQGVFVSSRQLLESLDSFFKLGQDVTRLAGLADQTSSGVLVTLPPETTFKDLPTATKRAILQRLSTASDDFDLLSARIEIAKVEFERLRANRLVAPFLGILDPYLLVIEGIHNELGVASTLAHVLPELSGLDGDRTHLLLFLNNDELRPGGGFIGTYGVLQTRHGEILSLATKDVYAIDSAVASEITTVPPEPLARYNAATQWFFRDANWSPDFSVSAQQAITMFEQESALLLDRPDVPSATHVDGVIGFTPTAVAALLAYLGPVEVAGQTFTSENVAELIEFQVEIGYAAQGIPPAQRKEILSELVSQIQERLVALPFTTWVHIFSVLSEEIQSKQLAVFTTNTSVQKALITSGWSGAVNNDTPDTQLFVDANLASLKSDPEVKRSLRYEVFRNESGDWVGRTTVTYDHQGTFDWRTTRYRSYARLFVPEGTTLVRVLGLNEGPQTAHDLGMFSIGGFVVVEPGQEHSVIYEYRLADQVVDAIAKKNYRLQVFKQMGTRDYPLTIDLDFDKNISNAVPAENRNEWGDDRYRLNTELSQDLMFEIAL